MVSKNKLIGVILAAGKGNRITPLNLEYPKPLLPVCNKPIMQYQIEAMKNLGIEEIYIVIGHLGSKIKKYFKDGKKFGVKIAYIKQKERLGIAHAVGQLEPYIKKPFILFLGDIFYVAKNLDKMFKIFERKKAGAVLAVKKETSPEAIKRNFSLVMGKNNLVKRVIEKPRYVTNLYKGCGIYIFDLPIFDAIRNTPRTAMRDEYEITTAIQLLIDYGHKVYPANVVEWDMNITFAQDLYQCNLEQLSRLKKDNVISPKAKICKKAEITNSIIGDNVVIKNKTEILNTVILSNSKINSRNVIKNALITPRTVFYNKL